MVWDAVGPPLALEVDVVKWGEEVPPIIQTATLKGYLLFDASQLAWQLASLAESARNLGLEPPEVATDGPEQLRDWITAQDA